MRLYLDTEFTDLNPDAKLISIALVDENENFFYAELTDTYELADCSDFVKQFVLPLLRNEPHRMSRMECAARIGAWIEEHNEECLVCSDNPDWDLPYLKRLIEYQWPQNLIISYLPIWVPNWAQEEIVMEGNLYIHNALDDAMIMKRYEIDK